MPAFGAVFCSDVACGFGAFVFACRSVYAFLDSLRRLPCVLASRVFVWCVLLLVSSGLDDVSGEVCVAHWYGILLSVPADWLVGN